MDTIDIRTLDWQENPNDSFAATAYVQAGDRKLRIDASFRPYYVQDAEPASRTAIIDALRGGQDFRHMHAQPVPMDSGRQRIRQLRHQQRPQPCPGA